jgi:site-specific DNA recombinase
VDRIPGAGHRGLVRDKLVSAVVFYCSDRLSRDDRKTLFFVDEFLSAGVELHFVTEPDFEDTPIGWLILHVRAFASALERERIIERTIRGKRAKLQSGRLIRACNLYGYRLLESGKRKVVPAEAEVVKHIFAWASQGVPIREIAARLSTEGIRSPRDKETWGRSTIARILREEAYRGRTLAWRWSRGGKLRPEDEWMELPEGTTPRIVSDGTWHRVQAQLRRNRELAARNLQHDGLYLLRSYVFCGHCGFPLWGEVRTRGERQTAEYRCRGRAGHAGSSCKQGSGLPSISAAALDRAVWREIERVVACPALLDREVKKRDARRGARSVPRSSGLEKELDAVVRGRERLVRALGSGEGDDAFAERLARELRATHDREVALRGKLRVAEAGDRVRAKRSAEASGGMIDLATLKKRLSGLDFDGKRLALEAVAARVQVFRAGSTVRAVLHITLPIPGTRGVEQSITLDTQSAIRSSSK